MINDANTYDPFAFAAVFWVNTWQNKDANNNLVMFRRSGTLSSIFCSPQMHLSSFKDKLKLLSICLLKLLFVCFQ